MTENLVLYHRKEPGRSLDLPQNHWHMATCLRSIIISDQKHESPEILEHYERKQGDSAYGFLLSVICGLDSPMLGETEILGQFKEFCRKNQKSFSVPMAEIVTQLKRDAKSVRTQYLQNLGCTSYGSLLRKNLKNQSGEFVLIGAGALTQDIVPWFAKMDVKIKVFTRRPEKYKELEEGQDNLQLLPMEQLTDLSSRGVLVVAAPMESKELHKKVNLDSFDHVYDLRGSSVDDPLEVKSATPLQTLFASIEKNKDQANKIRKKAFLAVEKHTVNLSLFEKQRPFGWEDLWTCA